MSKPDDGGPAFPRAAHTTDRQSDWLDVSEAQPGMSLRAWLAGQERTLPPDSFMPHMSRKGHDGYASILAAWRVKMADALIAELAKERP